MTEHLNITSKDFQDKVLNSDLPTLVDFWAPWCGPCKMIAPHVEQLSAEYEGRVNVYKVNIEDEPEVADKFGILSIPTLIMYKGGKEVGKNVGAISKTNIAELIDSAI